MEAYGYEWPELKDRMGAFREAVEIVTRMWTEDSPVFSGKHYSIDKPINEPKGVRKPHPSFWIGGGGENVTLKLVAKHANGANFGNGDPDVIREKLAILRRHCDTAGRDYDDIIKSTSVNVDLSWSPAQLQAAIDSVLEAGADYPILYFPRVAYDHTPLLRFAADIIPQYS